MENKKNEGLRFNEGKTRFDLLEPYAIEQLAKVFTYGAKKYAPNNWLKGQDWSKMIASMKRHINEFEKGNDYDFDPTCTDCATGGCTNHTGLFHMAHAAWNAMALVSYYKHRPENDDRRHSYLIKKKVGFDIDDCLADFIGTWTKHHGQEIPESWNFDRNIAKKFELLKDDKDFWLSLPVKTKPSEITFEPHCYITSRSIPNEWTEEWLDKNGFPQVPVYSVGHEQSKVEVAKQAGIDIFVDDRFDNFVELTNAGIFCYLFDAPHNQRYDVGFRRIKSLSEISA